MPVRGWNPGLVLAGLLAVTGCGGNARDGEETGSPVTQAAGTVEGTVRQTGSPPAVQTRLETAEGSVILVGDLAPEIGRVVGATVRVRGALGRSAGERTVVVRDYQIVAVDGRSPRVGEVIRLEGGTLGLRSGDGAVTPLRRATNRLQEAEGAWAWVVLAEDGSVARYGILRDP